MTEKLDLLQVAERVSDGRDVDWPAVERSAITPEERQVVRNLRLVESLRRVHGVQSAAGDPPTASCAAELEATVLQRDERTPARWGALEIRARIGAGAFGEVYRAWDPNLEREVALKLLKAASPAPDAQRVLQEGRLLARVSHPNVVTVHGAEIHDGRVGLWMELVRGRSLGDLVREQGMLGAREAALIGVDLCGALAAVHGAGLVHRDVKASNVMRQEGGRILLMDFGAGGDASEIEEGSISGTPLYIAPEVLEGQRATARSDIYSLGVLLYNLVTGSYPVRADNLHDLRQKHLRREARLLRDERPDLPGSFVKVVERALSFEPGARFATAGQAEQALAAMLGAEGVEVRPQIAPAPAPARDRALGLGLGVAAVAAVILIAVLWNRDPRPIQEKSVQDAAPKDDVRPSPEPLPPNAPASETKTPTAPPATAKHVSQAVQQATAPPASGSASYTVEAHTFRTLEDGGTERLQSGDEIRVGDRLGLEFRASKDVHVYVINEDDQGRAYALFPMPGLDLQNPVRAGETRFLPGTVAGHNKSWVVNSAGGREHLLVLASPDRLTDFEAELAKLPPAGSGAMAVELPEAAKVRLRGIGGLASSPVVARPGPSAGRLFDMAQRLAGRTEVVDGVWLRQIDLSNPER